MRLTSEPFQCPRSPAEFEEIRQQTLSSLLDLIGRPPFSTTPPLNPRIMYAADSSYGTRKKVRYGNESDDVVWAWLLIPKDLRHPAPAVICLPGTFMTPNWGKDGPVGLAGPRTPGDPEAYGSDLAKLGYVTLCPDYPVAGERTTPGLKSHDTTELDRRFPKWTRVGMSAWDVSRAVDFLETVPEVDESRIGCTGWSQGGQMTLLGAALEPRISVAISVCGWAPFRRLSEPSVENNVMSYNYPGLRRYAEQEERLPFDKDHVAACIAPRPFLTISAREDRFFPNRDEMESSLEQIAALYRLLGAKDHFQAVWAAGGHAYSNTAARESQAWFHGWLWRRRH